MSRRKLWLLAATFVALTILAISASALTNMFTYRGAAQIGHPSTPVFTDPIAGAWNCSIPPAGGAPGFTDLKNIHVGGTQSEIDNAAPPSQESPTVGTWVSTGPRTYSQKAYQMSWDPSGNFLGTWHYTGPMALSHSLNELSIEGNATLVDGNGNQVTSFPFTASCTRL
jgi:hypothetical protein